MVGLMIGSEEGSITSTGINLSCPVTTLLSMYDDDTYTSEISISFNWFESKIYVK